MLQIKLFLLFLLVSNTAFALNNLGVHGALYKIAESNFVEELRNEVSTKAYDAEKIARAGYKVNNYIPDAVTQRKKYEQFVFTAPETVTKDYKTVISKGQQINPLSKTKLLSKFLFLKDYQLPLYESRFYKDPAVVIMLIQGDASELIERYPDTTIYIANKRITDYLRIEYVPTLLYQEADRMVKYEIPFDHH